MNHTIFCRIKLKSHQIAVARTCSSLQTNYLINPYQCKFGTRTHCFVNAEPTINGQPMLLPEIKIPSSNQSRHDLQIAVQDFELNKLHEIQ